jgi:hypothetical protein
MMMRKVTRSKDGIPRFTVCVKHRIGRDWLIEFVASRLATDNLISSITELWKAVNDELKNRGGVAAYYWNDKNQVVEEEDERKFRRQATSMIDRWFLELMEN